MQQVITRTSEITFGEDNILRVKIFEGANISLKDVKEYYAFTHRITGGKPIPALIDGSADFSISEDARAYAATEADKMRVATALITHSVATRMIYNLYLRINTPASPSKVFTDEASAVKWLKTFSK
jgi:hypothetical protein